MSISSEAISTGEASRVRGGANDRLRPEIQGLRAVAVALVFAYHLWPDRLPGGFIGVDMFFVISGYLIIGHLVREVRATGSVRLGRFWERRARRILPLALVVLAVTGIASWLLTSGDDRLQYLEETIASVFFVENWLLAANSVDYIRADYDPSPVQHFWSLGVEEQFYIFLPLLIALTVAIVARRRGHVGDRPIIALLAVLFVASFALSVVLSTTSPSVAYFATPVRLWEFLAGGLLSLAVITLSASGRAVAAALGVALVAVSAFLVTGDAPFPGWIAIFPVVGTLLLIAAGSSTWFARASAAAPVLWLGGISYGVYLWHWPLIAFAPAAMDQIGVGAKALIIVSALGLAWFTKVVVEDPIRFSPRWRPKNRPTLTTLLAAATAMMLVAGTAYAGVSSIQREKAEVLAYLAAVDANQYPCFGAQSSDPELDCEGDLEGVVLPPLDVLRSDDANRDECWSGDSPPTLNVCSLGPDEGYELHAIALGDSYNAALISAYEVVAEQNNWRVDVASRRSCAWSSAGETLARSADCLAWNRLVDDYLENGSDYDLIITTASGRRPTDQLREGYQQSWTRVMESSGARVAVIASTPRALENHISCLKANRDRMNEACSNPREQAFAGTDGISEAAAATPGVLLIDLNDLICSGDPCEPVIGNAIVVRNGDHITRTFATTLGPYLAVRLREALDTQPAV